MIDNIPVLIQLQVDELVSVFNKERKKFKILGVDYPDDIKKLKDKAKGEWKALELLIEAEQVSRDGDRARSDFDKPNTEEITKIQTFVSPYNVELIKQLSRRPEDMHLLSPRQFEVMIAEILNDLGWEVELTPKSHDGGRDIIATIQFGPSRLLGIVECKRYSPVNKVGIDIVERFVHTIRDKDRASFGMLATSSYFTQGAWDVAQSHKWQLQLNDYNKLCFLLKNYGHYSQDSKTGLWVMTKT